MNSRTCRAIEANINDFSPGEIIEFRKLLCDEIYDIHDLITCIKKADGEEIHLDTALRDKYFDCFLKMHLS